MIAIFLIIALYLSLFLTFYVMDIEMGISNKLKACVVVNIILAVLSMIAIA